MENLFEIKILKCHWIPEDNPENKEDLCLHGKIFIRIGDEILSDIESDSWTLSAASLFLLRTLNMDYEPGDFENLLIPCCGHFIVAEDNKPVAVLGCPGGIEWTIKHIVGGLVRHISNNGSEAIISEEEYRKMVFDFSDRAEQLYIDNPRILPSNEFDLQGYNGFWKNWKELRNEKRV